MSPTEKSQLADWMTFEPASDVVCLTLQIFPGFLHQEFAFDYLSSASFLISRLHTFIRRFLWRSTTVHGVIITTLTFYKPGVRPCDSYDGCRTGFWGAATCILSSLLLSSHLIVCSSRFISLLLEPNNKALSIPSVVTFVAGLRYYD
jgi:hypothetical protein